MVVKTGLYYILFGKIFNSFCNHWLVTSLDKIFNLFYFLVGLQLARMQQPVKIIHKEQDAVTAFCINKVSSGLMALSTQKELQELDVSLLLNPDTWQDGMNEEADFDVLNLNE